mmetsp:Transcript_59983/g.111261  ORF Transcript_59983/g.111261 Transcript_59983/m.111261 type:complete len:127 (-) Transcript_59983:18-398(-)
MTLNSSRTSTFARGRLLGRPLMARSASTAAVSSVVTVCAVEGVLAGGLQASKKRQSSSEKAGGWLDDGLGLAGPLLISISAESQFAHWLARPFGPDHFRTAEQFEPTAMKQSGGVTWYIPLTPTWA